MSRHTKVISLLLFVSVLFAGPSLISAQDSGKSGQGASGQVFDSYPHPQTRGAMRYALTDKWPTNDLTYQFNNCPTFADCDGSMAEVVQAFEDWSAVSPLTFTEVSQGADIEIEWAGEEADMGPDSDTLGFAYFPSDGGDLFLNDSIEWEFDTGTEEDLYLTAAHEIGHALGLDHSDDPTSLMYPTSTDETTGIADPDVQAIQALYGSADGTPPTISTDNTPSSVPSDPSNPDETEVMEGEVDDSEPYEMWEIEAEAGETLAIRMIAVDGDLEPHLGVMTFDEETVLAESPDEGGTEAFVIVTFPESDSYLIVATRDGIEDGSSEGSYTLEVEEADAEQVEASGSSDEGVEVVNFTGTDVCEIYISPTDGEDWGEDILEGEPLADEDGFILDLEAGTYDAFAVTCDGDEIEEYELSVRQGSSIEIYEDVVAVYP